MRRVILTGVLLLLAAPLAAQPVGPAVVNPVTAKLEFRNIDQNNGILLSYQAYVFPDAAAEPFVGPLQPVVTSSVFPKTLAVPVVGSAGTYSLTFAQLGITTATLPACTVIQPLTCPNYSIVMVSIRGDRARAARGRQ